MTYTIVHFPTIYANNGLKSTVRCEILVENLAKFVK